MTADPAGAVALKQLGEAAEGGDEAREAQVKELLQKNAAKKWMSVIEGAAGVGRTDHVGVTKL